jgi:hypothetical protein
MAQNEIHMSKFDLDLIVNYDHQKAEEMTLEYPGCAEEVTVTQVVLKAPSGNVDLTHMLEELGVLDNFDAFVREELSE